MRKILFVANEDTHLYYFHMNDFKLLEELGFEVELAALEGFYTPAVRGQGRLYHNIPFSRNPLSRDNILAFFKLLDLFKRKKYDVVHVHNPVAAVITRLAARVANVGPVIYTAHGFHFHPLGGRIKNAVYLFIEKIMGCFTDYLLVMNNWDYYMAARYKIVKPENLFKVNGVGVDLVKFAPCLSFKPDEIKKNFRIKEGVTVVGCVAELIPRKNYKMLIDAAEEIVKRNERIQFLFVGNGACRHELEEIVRTKNLDDYIVFTGRIDDVVKALSIMDLLVLVSIHEGLPRAVQEAMAMGLPVIASDIRGNADLITDGINGFLVKLNDSSDLAQKILLLSSNEAIRKSMGEKNKEKIKQEYALEIVESQMRTIYSVIREGLEHK